MESTRKNTLSQTNLCFCIVLVLLVVSVYWSVQNYEFIDYDDNIYVYDNAQVKKGLTWQGIKWALFDTRVGHWHPLTWLSHMFDWQLFKGNAGGHHWTNVIIHLANTVFLFILLKRMTGEPTKSAICAALFAVHPINVESVAWVAERKNVLSQFFCFLTIGAYLYYLKRPSILRYSLLTLYFMLGLLTKPILVAIPFLLLLIDYWPLRRITYIDLRYHGVFAMMRNPPSLLYLLREKAPLMLISLLSIILTLIAAEQGSTLKSIDMFPFGLRIANALISYAEYVLKMIMPINLAVFYPYQFAIPVWQIIAATIFLAAVTFIIVKQQRQHPYLFFGWLWFLGSMIPVIGFVQVGYQAMADRYAYLSFVGLYVCFVWGAESIFNKLRIDVGWRILVTIALVTSLAICSWFQLRYWRNSYLLFQHALDVTHDNHIAHNILGNVSLGRNEVEKATW